ncbi:MAG: protein arginine kinase [Solirubrobacterales bacterium]
MALDNVLNSLNVAWMEANGPESDIAVSSRVRLARNLSVFPFPNLLRDEQTAREVVRRIQDALTGAAGLEMITFDQLGRLDRQILLEKHLISPEFAERELPLYGVILDEAGSISVMINEEDHLRIQCLLPGLQIESAHRCADQVDNLLEANLEFAFDERRGYLTACPTNVGTGMRASVMLHLPAITMTNQQGAIFSNIVHLGLAVRGLYGEGTQAVGNLYQISNQVTLGQSEYDIIGNLWTVAYHLIEQERNIRERLQHEMRYQLEDRVWRAYGLVTNARMITSNEALAMLSDVRLGVDLGILPPVSLKSLNELIIGIRPAHLMRAAIREMSSQERDLARAEIIKQKLAKPAKEE